MINIFLFISFNTQHHNITSTQNKTTDTYSTPQKSSQKEEKEGGKKKKQNKLFLYIIMYVKEKTLRMRCYKQIADQKMAQSSPAY